MARGAGWQGIGRAVSLGLLGILALVALSAIFAPPAFAATPEDDLRGANGVVRRALTEARAGDLVGAARDYKAYENTWFDIEDGIKDKSKDAYRIIEKLMTDVNVALAKQPADAPAVSAALGALDVAQNQFIAGQTITEPPGSGPGAATTGTKPTIASLLFLLADAQSALTKDDYATAGTKIKEFQTTWLDVEGEIKTRSAAAYRQTENDMALANTQAQQRSPETKATVVRMADRLEPFRQSTRYGIFDATIILLREGLEALLVLVALSAFLAKSGNAAKRPWVWGGAAVGLLVSIALGIALQVLLSSFINAGNRELIEGVTGLFAAVMLLYVSYWLHSKSSLGAWQTYLGDRTTTAITSGGLYGLALLSFLAVFREGAETVLFFLGMASNISTSDLVTGLGLGAGGLVVLGLLMTVAGLRIPMRPFFTVASVLVFYLCFKFVGSGIHAFEVAGVIASESNDALPAVDFFGIYPTWATTIPQFALLLIGAGIVLRGRVGRRIADRAA